MKNLRTVEKFFGVLWLLGAVVFVVAYVSAGFGSVLSGAPAGVDKSVEGLYWGVQLLGWILLLFSVLPPVIIGVLMFRGKARLMALILSVLVFVLGVGSVSSLSGVLRVALAGASVYVLYKQKKGTADVGIV